MKPAPPVMRMDADKNAKPQIVAEERLINAAPTPPNGHCSSDGNRVAQRRTTAGSPPTSLPISRAAEKVADPSFRVPHQLALQCKLVQSLNPSP
jgi:hypothetical protein